MAGAGEADVCDVLELELELELEELALLDVLEAEGCHVDWLPPHVWDELLMADFHMLANA